MKNSFEMLKEKFICINMKGYVKGINNNTNSAGLTFEKLIGKEADSDFFPDYKGIEIKTTTRYSRYNISLFTLSFDGPYLYESNYLLKKYGKIDKQYPEYKKLNVNLKYNKKVLINNKYFFKLYIDNKNKRIYISIYNRIGFLIEKRGFIDFISISERLYLKLNNLALIYASKKNINGDLYYRYYNFIYYKLKDFDTFIDLIKEGTIQLSLMLRFSRNIDNIGKNKNKNILFSIKKDSVDKLFKKIYTFEE